MVSPLKQALETPNHWLLFSVAGTVLCFSTLALTAVSPILIFFSMIPMILSPSFLVVTTWRHGLRLGLMVTGASSLLLLILFEPPVAILFLAQFAVVGLVVGEGLRRKERPLPLIFAATLIPTVLTIAIGFAYLLHAQATLPEMLRQGADALRLALEENVKRFQLDPAELMQYQKNVEILINFLKRSFPALLFANALTIVCVNLLFSLHLSDRLGLDRSHVFSFKEISIPFHWVWGLIGSGLLYLLKIPYLKWVGLNVAMIYLLGYLIQGYAILAFYLDRTRLPGSDSLIPGLISERGLLRKIVSLDPAPTDMEKTKDRNLRLFVSSSSDSEGSLISVGCRITETPIRPDR
jgi:hypothetical protein